MYFRLLMSTLLQATTSAHNAPLPHTPPTGFNALNTANLPAPDIADGSQYFDTVTYSDRAIKDGYVLFQMNGYIYSLILFGLKTGLLDTETTPMQRPYVI